MKGKRIILKVAIAGLILFNLFNCKPNGENRLVERIEQLEKENQLIVQLAELEIDPNQLEPYLELLEEGIRTSVADEPGVLSLYAMAHKDKPNRITVVEIYENQAAYESHIKSKHFLKYKNGTLEMVDSLKLIRTKPIVFAAKEN
ncbi:MAG: antibiotic biosynthesis monooxygenase [Bacteroidia bacterium]|nr:antibiotic biosynthesis monooxygenase [Bacteroidia bacterium]